MISSETNKYVKFVIHTTESMQCYALSQRVNQSRIDGGGSLRPLSVTAILRSCPSSSDTVGHKYCVPGAVRQSTHGCSLTVSDMTDSFSA